MKLKLILAFAAMLAFGAAQAKLAPPSDEAMAKAAEAKEKTGHGSKVAAYKLCLSQNRTAERYMKNTARKAPYRRLARIRVRSSHPLRRRPRQGHRPP
ncbi:MAG: hypothetical protein M5R42_20900 [Rhodocyclaceae bacterium]|nr:hypothetical protein [Rhodocyclaceae bacterium]